MDSRYKAPSSKVEDLNYQSDLCNFMTWILDITEPHNVDYINERLNLL